ncbi:sulfatase-like hydrolase/transferase [Tundrisphaera lichenicola]|uniref:sulfatase n=1 Tax=Tundrisphaera lichenicola TaxID=2029860 RepID=UPI003EB7035C
MGKPEARCNGDEMVHSRPGPLQILLWTAWFGLVSGFLELGVFLLKCHILDPRNYNTSRHLPWMYPLAGVMVLGGPGLVLSIIARARPQLLSTTMVVIPLAFLAYLGLLFRGPIYTAVCLILAIGLAIRTAWFLAARSERFGSFVNRTLIALLLMIVMTAASIRGREVWSERYPADSISEHSPSSKNVILIVLDTLRAKSMGLYGYSRNTTPNLDRIAGRGVQFVRAISTAPWTAPSHASMFTGKWPSELSVGWNRPLDDTSPTLAEYLKLRGYATAGFVANTTYCSYETGLDRGFDHYEDYDLSPREILLCSSLVQRSLNFLNKHPGLAPWIELAISSAGSRKDAARNHRDFLDWVANHQDRPFFAFINDFDAHHPYLVPDPDDSPEFGRKPESLSDYSTIKNWWELDKRQLGTDKLELARDSYDRCIGSLDRQIGRLFEDLQSLGILQNTMVVITADHGESLGEHRLFGHGCSLYLPEIQVPLILIDPSGGLEGRVIQDPVSLRDLPATVVERLGLDAGSPFSGRSLARYWTLDPSGTTREASPILSEIEAPPEADPNLGDSPATRGPMRSIVEGCFHYIRDGLGSEELYQIEEDPGELDNIAGSPKHTATMEKFRRSIRSLSQSK